VKHSSNRHRQVSGLEPGARAGSGKSGDIDIVAAIAISLG
jgi:hypothetical protein